MAPTYEIRAGGDVKNKKQSMADLKLRRLNELNGRLTEDLNRPRIKVSEAASSYVLLTRSDPLQVLDIFAVVFARRELC